MQAARKAKSGRGGWIVWMQASSRPSRSAIAGSAGSSVGSPVIRSGAAIPSTRRMMKNGLPQTAASSLAKSGSGTCTPAAKSAFCTANSWWRVRLAATPVAADVRNTSRCSPSSAPPEKRASSPQFSCSAPPLSGLKAVISTVLAALANARNRANAARHGSDRGDAVPAIDRDHRACQVRASRRSKQQHRAIEILGLPKALQRYARDQRLAGLGLEESAVEIGLDIARRQRVDENAVSRQFHRQHMRQVGQPGLGGAIGRHPAYRAQTEHRGDIDDATRAPRADQVMSEFTRCEPGALEVCVDHVVPIGLGVLEQRL